MRFGGVDFSPYTRPYYPGFEHCAGRLSRQCNGVSQHYPPPPHPPQIAGARSAGGVSGTVRTVAGTGIHGATDGSIAQFNLPGGIFSSGDGTSLYITDTYNNLIRNLNNTGRVRRITGEVLVLDDFGFPQGFHSDSSINTALFNRPTDGAVDEFGRLIIVDSENNSIRIIRSRNVYTFAGNTRSGHADGVASEARFNRPTAIAICPQGYIYIADTLNHVIRKIDRNGRVTTVAGTPGVSGFRDGAARSARLNRPGGIAISPDGRIYIADTGNHLIRVLEDGEMQTLAGTLRTSGTDNEPLGGFADGLEAMFSAPTGLSLWNGNLIVADTMNHSIRAILPGGETITIAGSSSPGYINDAPLRSAFHMPSGVHVRENTLYIADTGNNVIRAVELDGLEGMR